MTHLQKSENDTEPTENIFCSKIANSPLSRIIKRAGARRQGGKLHDYVKIFTYDYFLKPFVRQVTLVAKHNSRKTLIPSDVQAACAINHIDLAMGLNITEPTKTKGLYGGKNRGKKTADTKANDTEDDKKSTEAKKKRRKKPGTASLQEIKRLQKDSDCLELPISNFTAVVKDIASEYIENVRFREGTSKLIQLVTETWIYRLALNATCVACHRKGQTVSVNDVRLVLLITGEISVQEWQTLVDTAEEKIKIEE